MTSSLNAIDHVFVDAIPDVLDRAMLYVCIPFATVAHRCFCGCGEEVVTPLGRADWTLSFDGESVSLSPSIGSWSLPCRSHYVVTRNKVRWVRTWTESEIATGRKQDEMDREEVTSTTQDAVAETVRETATEPLEARAWWRQLLDWIRSGRSQ